MRALFVAVPVLLVLSACPPAECPPGADCACVSNCGTDAGTRTDAGVDAGMETVDGGSGWERYCGQHRRAYCSALERCGLFASASTCEASLTQFDCGQTPPGIGDGRVRFDEAAAASCLSQFASIGCGALDFVQCPGVLTGLGAVDAQCFGNDDECSSGLYCDSSMTCPGRCKAAAVLNAAPTPGQPCAAGTYVYDGKCANFVAVGSSCAPAGTDPNDRECVSTAFCEETSKICTAKKGAGERCTSYFECSGVLQCNAGSCGQLTSVNEACDDSSLCKSDLRCGDAGVCLTRGGVGAPCAIETDECTIQLFCDNGSCAPYRGVDAPCTLTGGECGLANGQYCTATFDSDGGVCAKVKAPGETCSDSFECMTGLCAGGQCVGCIDSTP
ncbi:MAG: hypothetical protein ACO1OB_07595 [Archangium sp.]